MSHRNYHQEAIGILERGTFNKDAMLWWIAKHHPSVFVWSDRMTTKTDPSGEAVDRQVLGHIKAGNLLNAIKRYRESTPGMGLKESKDYCDGLKATLGL